MPQENEVKPYLIRIKNWQIRNMVMLYLEAREKFKNYRRMVRSGVFLSFEKMREICDVLFEIKEAHHLLFKKLVNPKKMKYEKTNKFTPDEVEMQFMNNIGLLFHKVMVARELKYLMEHYFEESEEFKKSQEELQNHLKKIDALFDDCIEIVKSLIQKYKNNILLLTLLLDEPDRTKKHFGQNAEEIIEQFGNAKDLDEVFYCVGKYYAHNGWKSKAKEMFREALKRNPKHQNAQKNLLHLT